MNQYRAFQGYVTSKQLNTWLLRMLWRQFGKKWRSFLLRYLWIRNARKPIRNKKPLNFKYLSENKGHDFSNLLLKHCCDTVKIGISIGESGHRLSNLGLISNIPILMNSTYSPKRRMIKSSLVKLYKSQVKDKTLILRLLRVVVWFKLIANSKFARNGA